MKTPIQNNDKAGGTGHIAFGYTSVPFKAESGLSTVNGLAKFSSAGIVLEFESKLFGIISGGVKEVRLPISEILDAKFRKGFFRLGAKIEIRTKTLAALADLPNKDGKLTLKLLREDFVRGREAVAQLNLDMAEYERDLPPSQINVSQLFGDDDEVETKTLKK